MFGSEILEVAIGLVFIYLIASFVATSIREAVEGFLKTRAIHLERGIRQLLDDPSGQGVTKQLFDHSLLFSLFPGRYDPSKLTPFFLGWRRGEETDQLGNSTIAKRVGFASELPSYVPSANFALALMHVVAGTGTDGNGGVLSIDSVKNGAMLLPEGRLKQAMLVALGEAKGDLDRARASLEGWYDGAMDRVSGWYKRETSWILFVIGLVTAVMLNVDSLNIVHSLATNNTLRAKLIAQVEQTFPADKRDSKDAGAAGAKGAAGAEDGAGGAKRRILSNEEVDRAVAGLSGVIGYDALKEKEKNDLWTKVDKTMPKGLSEDEKKAWRAKHQPWVDEQMGSWHVWLTYWFPTVPGSLLGWLLSALAISLGAPFWFDLLNKLMVIRSTVKPYEKSPPEPSADRGGSDRVDPLHRPAAGPGAPAPPPSPQGGAGAPALPGGGPPQPAAPVTPSTANLRFAFDGADAETLQVTDGGVPATVPDDGFLELPFQVGVSKEVAATGTKDGKPVAWKETFNVKRDDDQRHIAATLV